MTGQIKKIRKLAVSNNSFSVLNTSLFKAFLSRAPSFFFSLLGFLFTSDDCWFSVIRTSDCLDDQQNMLCATLSLFFEIFPHTSKDVISSQIPIIQVWLFGLVTKKNACRSQKDKPNVGICKKLIKDCHPPSSCRFKETRPRSLCW